MAEECVAYLWTTCSSPLVRDALGWCSANDVLQKLQMPRVKHFAEFFCGTGGLVAEVDRRGLRCSWFDLVVDDRHNLLTPKGFAMAIEMAMAIVPNGMAWFGVPCSTFVWISRGHTKRSRATPLGDELRSDVRNANRIVRRVLVILNILVRRSVFFIIEQPAGSLLWRMPGVRRIARSVQIKNIKWQRRFVWLGHYGHRIAKPSELQGVFPDLQNILPSKRPQQKSAIGIYKMWRGATGKVRVCGCPGLKSTEHYPDQFCKAVASLVQRLHPERAAVTH